MEIKTHARNEVKLRWMIHVKKTSSRIKGSLYAHGKRLENTVCMWGTDSIEVLVRKFIKFFYLGDVYNQGNEKSVKSWKKK